MDRLSELGSWLHHTSVKLGNLFNLDTLYQNGGNNGYLFDRGVVMIKCINTGKMIILLPVYRTGSLTVLTLTECEEVCKKLSDLLSFPAPAMQLSLVPKAIGTRVSFGYSILSSTGFSSDMRPNCPYCFQAITQWRFICS